MINREHDGKAALEAGVDSYLLLDCPIEESVAAVGARGRSVTTQPPRSLHAPGPLPNGNAESRVRPEGQNLL